MRVKPERLVEHLERHGLPGACIIFGDEPLQLLESGDALRATARSAGVEERLVFDAGKGFDWSRLADASNAMSLFASRRLLEIRLGTSKPDAAGSTALVELLEKRAPEDAVLVTADKLDRRAQAGRWFKTLETAGLVVQIWPVRADQLGRWLIARARRHGKTLSPEAAELVAAQVEGNLLAAAQEIEKLCLVIDVEGIGLEAVIAVVSDSSRHDVFGLVDAALAGDAARTLRILRGLRGEGTEPGVASWALNRELRLLSLLAGDVARGTAADAAMAGRGVWSTRHGVVRQALRRHRPAALTAMLRHSAVIDRMVKGATRGNPWDELEQLCLRLAGRAVFHATVGGHPEPRRLAADADGRY